MSFKAICPDCGASYSMSDRSKEGKKLKCKKCGGKFVANLEESSSSKPSKSRSKPEKLMAPPPKVRGKDAIRNEPKPGELEEVAAGGTSKPVMIGAIFLFIAFWGGVIFAVSQMEFKPSGPTEVQQVQLPMTQGKSAQGNIGVEYPTEWKFETDGGQGGVAEWIRITGDDISVSIRTNLKASAMGDIASAGGTIQDEEVPEELEPIAAVHDFLQADMQSIMEPYEEEAPEKIETKAGNSRISKFQGDRGFVNGGMAYGYRATLPSGNDKLKVVCTCESEKDLEKYDSLLRKMILSIGRP